MLKIGFGKSRIAYFILFGIGVAMVLYGAHAFLEWRDIPHNNWLIAVFVPVLGGGMALLAYRENALYKWGSRLDDARKHVNELMQVAVEERHWQRALEDESLATCWQQLDCDNDKCPVFGKEHARCWLIAGTFCRGEVQGKFARKLKDCRLCDVYKKATIDPVREISENFQAMSYLLAEREEELNTAVEESRNHSGKLEGLVSLSELAISTLQLSELLKELLESTVTVAGADVGVVSLLDSHGDNLVPRAIYGFEPRRDKGLATPVGEGLVGKALRENRTIIIQDALTDSLSRGSAWEQLGAKVLISIPLQSRGEAQGVLTLGTVTAHVFTEQETNTLNVAASRIAAVVLNHRLESELDHEREIVTLVRDLAEQTDSRGGIIGVYRSFVNMASRLLDFDRASLAIWHPEAEEFELVAIDTRAPRTWLGTGLRLPRYALPLGKVIDDKRYLLRKNIDGNEYPADKLLVEEGVCSQAIFPLIYHGEALGTLSLGSFQTDAFSPEDGEMLEPLIRQLGVLLENARTLQQEQKTSLVDTLSGLYNHRFFYEATVREVARGMRYGRPVSVAIFDLEGFGGLLDRHPANEAEGLARQAAKAITGIIRNIDIAARYRGDEFAVLLPELGLEEDKEDEKGLVCIAARIRESIISVLPANEENELPANEGKKGKNEIFVGIAVFPDCAGDATVLLESAESALVRARESSDKLAIADTAG